MKYNFYFHFSDIAMAFKFNQGHWGEKERERERGRKREGESDREIYIAANGKSSGNLLSIKSCHVRVIDRLTDGHLVTVNNRQLKIKMYKI